MTSTEIKALARQDFEEVSSKTAMGAGVTLPPEYILRLIGDLSDMGPLLELIVRFDIEDIAINLGNIHVYTTTNGWEHAGRALDGIDDALRVMIDRAGRVRQHQITQLPMPCCRLWSRSWMGQYQGKGAYQLCDTAPYLYLSRARDYYPPAIVRCVLAFEQRI